MYHVRTTTGGLTVPVEKGFGFRLGSGVAMQGAGGMPWVMSPDSGGPRSVPGVCRTVVSPTRADSSGTVTARHAWVPRSSQCCLDFRIILARDSGSL